MVNHSKNFVNARTINIRDNNNILHRRIPVHTMLRDITGN